MAAPSRRPRGALAYDGRVTPPAGADDWIGAVRRPLPLGAAADWAVLPDCGAVVVFSGTARDHSDGRARASPPSSTRPTRSRPCRGCEAIAAEARRRWPELGRLVLLHRIGPVPVGESAVVVVASAPHRAEAFDAARFGIDALKATVPIWKRETWDGGESWGLEAPAPRRARRSDRGDGAAREQRRRSSCIAVGVSVARLGAGLGRQPQAQDVHVEHRRLPREMEALGRDPERAAERTPPRRPAHRPRPARSATPTEERRPWPATSPSISAPPTRSSTRGARASC